jgi:hypothetical protein
VRGAAAGVGIESGAAEDPDTADLLVADPMMSGASSAADPVGARVTVGEGAPSTEDPVALPGKSAAEDLGLPLVTVGEGGSSAENPGGGPACFHVGRRWRVGCAWTV